MKTLYKLLSQIDRNTPNCLISCIEHCHLQPPTPKTTREAVPRKASSTHNLIASPDSELRRSSGDKVQIGAGTFGTVVKGTIGQDDIPIARKSPVKPTEADINRRLLADYRSGDHLMVGRLHGEDLVMAEMDMTASTVLNELRADGPLESPTNFTLNDRFTFLLATVTATLKGLSKLYTVTSHVHRDIKPNNILIRRDKGGIKLSDFGESKLFGQNGTTANTFSYYPAGSNERLSPTVDLWGVLIVAAEFLTPEPIYKGNGMTQIYLFGKLLSDLRKGPLTPESLQDGLKTFCKTCGITDPSALAKFEQVALPLFAAVVLPIEGKQHETMDRLVTFYEEALVSHCSLPEQKLSELFTRVYNLRHRPLMEEVTDTLSPLSNRSFRGSEGILVDTLPTPMSIDEDGPEVFIS